MTLPVARDAAAHRRVPRGYRCRRGRAQAARPPARRAADHRPGGRDAGAPPQASECPARQRAGRAGASPAGAGFGLGRVPSTLRFAAARDREGDRGPARSRSAGEVHPAPPGVRPAPPRSSSSTTGSIVSSSRRLANRAWRLRGSRRYWPNDDRNPRVAMAPPRPLHPAAAGVSVLDAAALARARDLAVGGGARAARADPRALSRSRPRRRNEGGRLSGHRDGSAAEAIIRDRLRGSAEFGRFEILGEEGGAEPGSGGYRWLVDPIDGTRAFARRLPTFGTIVALEERASGRGLVGAIHLPVTDETLAGARGLGAERDGRPLRASEAHRPAHRDRRAARRHRLPPGRNGARVGCRPPGLRSGARLHRLLGACPGDLRRGGR